MPLCLWFLLFTFADQVFAPVFVAVYQTISSCAFVALQVGNRTLATLLPGLTTVTVQVVALVGVA